MTQTGTQAKGLVDNQPFERSQEERKTFRKVSAFAAASPGSDICLVPRQVVAIGDESPAFKTTTAPLFKRGS